jgi:gluconokinase
MAKRNTQSPSPAFLGGEGRSKHQRKAPLFCALPSPRPCDIAATTLKNPMQKLIVMGVSGAGKSTLGAALATALGWAFLDADDFHTDNAKAKIASGQTLDEDDRAIWLAAIAPALNAPPHSKVLACSALKATHRDTLSPDFLVHLVITPELAATRLSQRTNHFAGPSIAASQFATLQAPEHAICVQAHWPTQVQVRSVLSQMRA